MFQTFQTMFSFTWHLMRRNMEAVNLSFVQTLVVPVFKLMRHNFKDMSRRLKTQDTAASQRLRSSVIQRKKRQGSRRIQPLHRSFGLEPRKTWKLETFTSCSGINKSETFALERWNQWNEEEHKHH